MDLDYWVHRKISGFYSSRPEWTGGVRVRDYLAGKSFEYQYDFGMRELQRIMMEMGVK